MPPPLPLAPPLELTFRGTNDVVAYACPRCGTIVSPEPFGTDSEAYELASKLASEHCNRHCRCGVSIPNSRMLCNACWQADQAERDAKKFERAEKMTEEDYPSDPVYWEGKSGSMGDGYFESTDEVRDYCEQEDIPLPEYVWACNPVEFRLDVENILESAFQEHCEAARDALLPSAEAELSVFLFAWCERQNICSWQADFLRAVVLDKGEKNAVDDESCSAPAGGEEGAEGGSDHRPRRRVVELAPSGSERRADP